MSNLDGAVYVLRVRGLPNDEARLDYTCYVDGKPCEACKTTRKETDGERTLCPAHWQSFKAAFKANGRRMKRVHREKREATA